MTKMQPCKAHLIASGGIACCIGLSLLCFFAVILPMLRHHSAVERERVEMNAATAKASQVAWQVSQAQSTLADLTKGVETNPLKLMSVDHLDDRLADITNFSTACGLEVHDLTPGVAREDTRFQVVPIRLTGRADYRTCAIFLHRLHEHFLDVSVNSFRLTSNSGDSVGTLSVQFELAWFAKPDHFASSQ